MKSPTVKKTKETSFQEIILDFLNHSKGLKWDWVKKGKTIKILQKMDNKFIELKMDDVKEVLARQDIKKEPFLQVNFKNSKKILLTDNLIGFKPVSCQALDMTRIPNVVTTPDLISVIEALEEALFELDVEREINEMKLYFQSISYGAEAVGFDLTYERLWIQRLFSSHHLVANSS